MTDLPGIDAPARCYISKNLSLTVLDPDTALHKESLREIQLDFKKAEVTDSITLIVFDEHEDTKIQNPVLWLHLIIDTCEGFEKAIDYQEWRRGEAYKDTPFFQTLYDTYSRLIPEIRKVAGNAVKALDARHIELNTNVAQALRNYRL